MSRDDWEKAIDPVAQGLTNLGASQEQSRVMAAQLVKRAGQLSQSRGTSFASELAKLLETVSCGSQGRLKPSESEDFS